MTHRVRQAERKSGAKSHFHQQWSFIVDVSWAVKSMDEANPSTMVCGTSTMIFRVAPATTHFGQQWFWASTMILPAPGRQVHG